MELKTYKSLTQFYKQLWKERDHVCFVTKEPLDKYYYSSYRRNIFMHVIPKGKFPEYKFNCENMVLGTPQVHSLFDNAVLDQILKFEKETGHSFSPLFRLEVDLMRKYCEEFNVQVPLRKVTERYLDSK